MADGEQLDDWNFFKIQLWNAITVANSTHTHLQRCVCVYIFMDRCGPPLSRCDVEVVIGAHICARKTTT